MFSGHQQVFNLQPSYQFALPQVVLALDVHPVSFGFNQRFIGRGHNVNVQRVINRSRSRSSSRSSSRSRSRSSSRSSFSFCR